MTKKWSTNDFAIGLYNLHPNLSINFQMNRFYNWTNDKTMLDEMKEIGSIIHSYDDLIKSFINLGENALKKNEKLKAAYYFRGAEFFIPESDPHKRELRSKFISLSNEYYGISKNQHYLIPYENGFLSAYRFTPENPKGIVVFCNGFDGYIEEVNLMMLVFKDAGYDVISFDGPGQGTSLEDYKMPMTHEWEKPVKSLLDYFNLNNITLIGMSLGGYLALRAAAYEKRIKKVIAYDILPDFSKVILHQIIPVIHKINPSIKDPEDFLIHGKIEKVNTILNNLMEKSLMLEWGLKQGMHVTGSNSPYEFIHKIISYNTANFSNLITQDVLLLAGQDDHYVPIEELSEQIKTLTKVRSLTARMFTTNENASSHCQMGNIGLAVNVMLSWIDMLTIQ